MRKVFRIRIIQIQNYPVVLRFQRSQGTGHNRINLSFNFLCYFFKLVFFHFLQYVLVTKPFAGTEGYRLECQIARRYYIRMQLLLIATLNAIL